MTLKFNKLALVFAAASLVFPSLTFAVTTTSNFCTNISTIGSNMDQRLTTRMTNLTDHQNQVLGDIQSRRSALNTQLADERNQWAQDRQNQFTALQNHATTDAQKQAVQTFITGLTADIATREKTVDAAIATFRTGVDKAVADHQQTMSAVINTYQTSVDAAIAKAKSDCSSGVAPATARATFRASIQEAIKALQTQHQNVDKLGPQIQALAKTRNQTVQTALQTFRTTAEQLSAALKQALGQTSTSTTNQ